MTPMEFWTDFWLKSLPKPAVAPAWTGVNPWQAWSGYWIDACQRTVLVWEVMRRRGNAFLEHEDKDKPPVRTLPAPVNYSLLRIVPPAGTTVDPTRRPLVVITLFVGNKLAGAEVVPSADRRIDLRNIRSPIVVFASWGDNITPPQQALNWIRARAPIILTSRADNERTRLASCAVAALYARARRARPEAAA